MAKLGIMIEAQEGLTWDHWRRLCHDVEALGFASLRRSDHMFSVMGVAGREGLECWTSLALAAEWTRSIEIGPMVSPITFRPPAILARMAAAVDVMSGGRLLLGVGAGWNQAEHEAFGLPFPSVRERFDNLEAGIELMRATWKLVGPAPVRGSMPLLIGGSGERRTLSLVAREAAEWNYVGTDMDAYRGKAAVLDEHCRRIGRNAAEIRRSLMVGHLVGRDRAELLERARRMAEFVPRFREMSAEQVLDAVRVSWLAGTPEDCVARIREWEREGVQLVMLQHLLLDDADALRLLAEQVMPAVA